MTDKNALTEIQTNVTVGMDEVVSVFISQYETNLFDQKDALSKEIKRLKGSIKFLDDTLKNSVIQSNYETTNDVIGISSTVTAIVVNWAEETNRHSKTEIVVGLEIKDMDNSNRYSGSMSKSVRLPISDVDIVDHKQLNEQLADQNQQLVETMQLIKSVSRKERQVRGEISKRKLEESGLKSLLEDESMLQLVQL